jgi:hypothetical protein
MKKRVINGINLRTEWNTFKHLAKIYKWMDILEDKERWAKSGPFKVDLPYSHPETMNDVPKVGEVRHFFDDGKIKESRHFIATIIEVIPFNKVPNKLKKIIKLERLSCYWLYAYETDYVIKASIPKYDKKPIYFVRTKDGGWFSIDYNGWWMSGRLMDKDFNWEEFLEEQEREIEEFRKKHNIK